MSDEIVVQEAEAVEADEVVKKPGLEFEDEWEVISEEQAAAEPMEDESSKTEEPKDIDAIIAKKMAQFKPENNNNELAEVLKDLKTTLAPKQEAAKPRDWDKFEEELAEKLTDDPKQAFKMFREAYSQEVGGAMQYLQQQNTESQKTISKLTAKSDPNLSMVFDKWSDEIDAEASAIGIQPGQKVGDVYKDAAQKVKMRHFDDILEAKISEAIEKIKPDASLPPKGIRKTAGEPNVEGQARKKVQYIATPEQLKKINSSINPDIMREKMIRNGELKKRTL
jgi:uncharacterized protein YeaO (DUF488 family)